MFGFLFKLCLVGAALLWLDAAPGAEAADADVPAAVLAGFAHAVDAGDRAAFLDLIQREVRERPALAPDMAAAASLLAPWLADRVAEAVLRGSPQPAAAAPAVLAAVLFALDGRRSQDVGAAVRQAAPQADGALLGAVEAVFAKAVEGGTSGGFLAAELVGLRPEVARAVASGRAATGKAGRWVRLWEGLAPLPVASSPVEAGNTVEVPSILRQDPILESRFRVPSGS